MILDNKTILFQGDSITDMMRGRNSKDPNHFYGHSYVFLLAGKFGYETPDKHITVYNRGVSGDRSVDVYARWQEDALALKPNVVSILVGINDILLGVEEKARGVSAEKYAQVLGHIIEDTRAVFPEVQFVLCEPFVHLASLNEGCRATFAQQVPLHQQAVRQVAEQYGCLFVPLQAAFDAAYAAWPNVGPDYWIWDGIHPTAAGQQIIARQWLACVENQK